MLMVVVIKDLELKGISNWNSQLSTYNRCDWWVKSMESLSLQYLGHSLWLNCWLITDMDQA